MFENDYTIVGKHATYLKFLVNDAKIFSRYIDVYMNAATIGFLHGKVVKKDSTSQDRARIYADVFANEKMNCDFIYRMIMILDLTQDLNEQQRVDRAFRQDAEKNKNISDQNLELFNAYVLGGIEELYAMFIEGCSNRDDYINKIYDTVTNFKDEIEGSIDYENKLKELIHS